MRTRFGTVGLSIAAVLAVALVFAGAANAKSLPKMLTQLPGRAQFQVRPYVVDFTGDGSAYLGGFARARSHSARTRGYGLWAGRLHWTTWNASEGRAYGADWIDNGMPDTATGTLYPYRVSVHVYRPRDGIFTRMTIVQHVQGIPTTSTFYPAHVNGPFYGWSHLGS